MKKFVLCVFLIGLTSVFGFAQKTPSGAKPNVVNPIKSTPAFAEVLLQKTETEAELESLLVTYTEEYPKIKSLRLTLKLLNKELESFLKLDTSQVSKLSTALGKLILRKVETEVEVNELLEEETEKSPEVMRLRKKLQIFEKAVKEIMQ